MKRITKETFLKALFNSLNKTQLMRNLGYKGGYKISQIKDWEKEFNICIDEIIKRNIDEYNNLHIKYYKCKNCGKEFTEKYSKWSDGNFCCKKCATSFSSNINKNDRINKIKLLSKGKKYIKGIIINLEEEYNKNPKLCPICNKPIPYEKRIYKTCSKECSHKLCSKSHKEKGVYNIGGYVPFSCRGKHGYYKGIYCDSTYELAYLIYCLDHNIDIKRCNETFEYEYEGKKHKYHPDFIVEGIITEIKNYNTNLVDIKAESVNKPYKILYYDDLQEVFEYVARTYNKKYTKHKNNFYELYDNFFTDR